jgi:hypothetical protein
MKKNRLLEIIREEIAGTLNEAGLGDQIAALDKQIEQATKQIAPLQKKKADLEGKKAILSKKEADLSTKTQAQLEESQLDEDMLTEAPFIGGSLDFAYIDGKLEKGILGKAIADATQEIKKSFSGADPDAATKIVMSKKSRTAPSTPEPVKAALEKVDDIIQAQADTFEDERLLKKLKDSEEFTTDEQVAIESYIEKATVPNEKGDVKRYTDKLGFPQTLRAVEKSLSGEAPTNVEPSMTTEPATKAPKIATEPKTTAEPKASKTAAEPKKVEPAKIKDSDEDKATKAAKSGSSKLEKMSNDKDALLKSKKAAEDKMKELAGKIKSAEGNEKSTLMDELKKVNKLKSELEAKLNKLGY